MLQLPYIPGPWVFLQFVGGLPGEERHFFPVFVRIFLQEMLCQQGNVIPPLPQRRHIYLNGIYPVIEVLPELTLFNHPGKICICGADEPYIQRNLPCPSQSAYAPVLQHCQQFGLHWKGKVPNLIKEKCPPVCQFNPPGLAPLGICKSPFFIPEQFALKQLLRNAPQIYMHKTPPAPRGTLVQHPGNKVLPRTVLPKHQHICIGAGNLPYSIKNFIHSGRLPNHICCPGGIILHCGNLFPQGIRLKPAFPQFYSRQHSSQQFLLLPRLGNEIGCPGLDGPYRLFGI